MVGSFSVLPWVGLLNAGHVVVTAFAVGVGEAVRRSRVVVRRRSVAELIRVSCDARRSRRNWNTLSCATKCVRQLRFEFGLVENRLQYARHYRSRCSTG